MFYTENYPKKTRFLQRQERRFSAQIHRVSGFLEKRHVTFLILMLTSNILSQLTIKCCEVMQVASYRLFIFSKYLTKNIFFVGIHLNVRSELQGSFFYVVIRWGLHVSRIYISQFLQVYLLRVACAWRNIDKDSRLPSHNFLRLVL